MSDWEGREAEGRGLRVIGALGVLLDAHRLGYVGDPFEDLRQLSSCGFRISERLIREFTIRLAIAGSPKTS